MDQKSKKQLKNLLDLAADGNNSNESAAAMRAAVKLARKHNYDLDPDKIRLLDVSEEMIDIDGAQAQPWERALFNCVAYLNYCELQWLDCQGNGNMHSYIIMGLSHNTEIAISMFEYLKESVIRHTDRFIEKTKSETTIGIRKGATKSIKSKFRKGFTTGLVDRLLEEAQAWGRDESREHALVATEEKARALAKEYAEENYGDPRMMKNNSLNDSGSKIFRQGFRDSSDVCLEKQIKAKEQLAITRQPVS